MKTPPRTPLELMTPAEIQAATGRAYLRGAVTLAEHAVVLLAHVPEEELVPVDGLVARLAEAVEYLRDHEAPEVIVPAEPEPAAPSGALW